MVQGLCTEKRAPPELTSDQLDLTEDMSFVSSCPGAAETSSPMFPMKTFLLNVLTAVNMMTVGNKHPLSLTSQLGIVLPFTIKASNE